jgi:hypothetical protein
MKMEMLELHDRVTSPNSEFYQKPMEFAMHTFAFYFCSQCNHPLYGGHRECDPGAAGAGQQPAAVRVESGRRCISCRGSDGLGGCPIHGADYSIFKCRFCCSPATFFCGGMCHYCDPCHDRAGALTDFSMGSFLLSWSSHIV